MTTVNNQNANASWLRADLNILFLGRNFFFFFIFLISMEKGAKRVGLNANGVITKSNTHSCND